MTAPDRYDLARFVNAQEPIYETALGELRRGAKRSHWMWFIFPQIAGLGSSAMAERYAIHSRAEAEAYLADPLLGWRLQECAAALVSVEGKSAEQLMGYPDCLKLKSSMTLFAALSPPDSIFDRVLQKFYSGEKDPQTLAFLSAKSADRG